METLMGLITAIDTILASPGVGSDFSIAETLMTAINSLLEQVLVFIEQYNILEALAALGIEIGF